MRVVIIAEKDHGIFFLKINLPTVGLEKRKFEFTDGTLPLELMVMHRMVSFTFVVFMVVY